ncbi:MAG: D-glycero-beta-D-manno-heptose-7-phosphate kinase [Proteobacteria bacterium]|nr:D-glycero-beta-D-manno-heptose-7-phosphate kinase [Pseudomonadota bacterium]MBU1138623.1 D-glycero-beta-D-manno-heptose-7-phosphate kinase [Pseudomonadota bacterium]MBU1233069.1 D-glycero-beta-D-manno-heptose-7-phosphate kinase [Pseudomonadota bacterium]MBU1419235.1 D-glycero-beta-D-manno-heptose-7-phosphate kinase [Pseudomonadota bacterium]MBU1453863.1 D-glycero-beta-D-manno-heptose-7-phosphate kinase [Pseudomonadota bacterium]
MMSELEGLVQQVAGKKILVVGDIIVDHFIWGTVSRISPEAPVPVVNVTKEELLLGGGANVLHNIYSLGAEAVLCGIIGNDEMGGRLQGLLQDLGASTHGLVKGKRPTTVKTRVVAQGQQVVRFDREQTGTPSETTIAAMNSFLEENIADFDAIIISDYYKGVISKPLMNHLLTRVAQVEKETGRKIPVVVDPKPEQPDRFFGATLITPNHIEAEKMSGIRIRNIEELRAAAEILLQQVGCQAVLITRGEAGMALLEKGKELVSIPTTAREVFDVTGAGDTVIAVLALGLAVGAPFGVAAALANIAAGVVVGKVGTATVSPEELLAVLHGEEKIETAFTSCG